MRAVWRTLDRALVRNVLAVAAAACVIGISFGAIAVASGLPIWATIAMSVLVFAGGSQFMAVGMIAAGSPVAAVFAGLLLNARHLPFGLAVADAVGTSARARLVGSHLLIDESVAFAMAESDPARRRAAYWLTGGLLFVLWNSGTVLGAVLGSAVGDPATLGLDAAFPAGLLALMLPALRDAETRRAAVGGAAIAVVATPFLPAGLPILLALLGLVLALRPARIVGPPVGAAERSPRSSGPIQEAYSGPPVGAAERSPTPIPARPRPTRADPERARSSGPNEEA